jgi:nitrite reductase (cytochrome c-552)
MSNGSSPSGQARRGGYLVGIAVVAALIVAGLAAFLVNINERKQEARNPVVRVVEITDETVDPAIWG